MAQYRQSYSSLSADWNSHKPSDTDLYLVSFFISKRSSFKNFNRKNSAKMLWLLSIKVIKISSAVSCQVLKSS